MIKTDLVLCSNSPEDSRVHVLSPEQLKSGQFKFLWTGSRVFEWMNSVTFRQFVSHTLCVSSQRFKASTLSTRSRASRRPEVWTASTRGCRRAATASSTRSSRPPTTCPPAPGRRTRTEPTHRPESSPAAPPSPLLLPFLPSFLPSLLPPSLALFSPFRAGEEAVQSERLSPRLIYFIID